MAGIAGRMTKLAFDAGVQPHFAKLLAPLYLGLPEHLRGTFYARNRAHTVLRDDFGIWANGKRVTPADRKAPVVVASHEDYRTVRPAPVVMVNHGIGQRYWGRMNDRGYRHPSYSGGRDRERVILNLCPSASDAAVNEQWWPEAKSVACGPWRLDPWLKGLRTREPEPGLVVLSFHCDANIVAETRWAFGEYKQAISDLASSGEFNLAGHGHPRFQTYLKGFWKMIGIPFIEDFDDVLDRASLYVCDNSSSQMETAALGIPNVVLNASTYRRDVNHGLRFWDAIPGPQVDDPDDLAGAITLALDDPLEHQTMRDAAIQRVYDGGVLDGRATERAVTALIELAETWDAG